MGTTERRRREALERRRSILAAAKKLFWKNGYARTTMPQVAAQAELAPGTLYLYFPSKDALYVELLSEGYDLLQARLEQAASREGEPAELGVALINAFFGFAGEFPEYFDIIFFILQRENTTGWEVEFPVEQIRRLEAKEFACKRAVASLLKRLNLGPLKKRMEMVDAVWSMLAGVVFFFRNKESFDDVAGQARDLLLSAVFGQGRG
jgi:AcrR family transcriptional regulator